MLLLTSTAVPIRSKHWDGIDHHGFADCVFSVKGLHFHVGISRLMPVLFFSGLTDCVQS